MAFTVEDFQDLIKLLAQHPEWRTELRRHVLSDDLIELPELVRRLVEAQTRAEARLEGVEGRLERVEGRLEGLEEGQARLAEGQARLEEGHRRLEAALQTLAEAQAQTEATLREIAQWQRRTEEWQGRTEEWQGRTEEWQRRTEEWQKRTDDRLGHLEGRALENGLERNGPGYLGPIARRLRVIEPGPLADLLDDAVDEGRLTLEERDTIMRSDVVLTGRRRHDGLEIYLLVEASVGVRAHDVERAVERAALLSKLGRPVLPVVAGHRIHRDAAELARRLGAWTAEGGHITPPLIQ